VQHVASRPPLIYLVGCFRPDAEASKARPDGRFSSARGMEFLRGMVNGSMRKTHSAGSVHHPVKGRGLVSRRWNGSSRQSESSGHIRLRFTLWDPPLLNGPLQNTRVPGLVP